MIIAAIIIGIILIFFVCLTFYISNRNDGKFDDGVTLGAIIAMLIFIEASLIGHITSDPQPSAIDVYRNDTELKVTYEICNGDTLSCDSIVVFKEEVIAY